MSKLKEARRNMVRRQRRIIFNNDGDDLAQIGGNARPEVLDFGIAKKNTELPVTPDGLLQVRTTALVGSHVDAIWYHSSQGMKLYYCDGPFGKLHGSPNLQDVATENYKTLTVDYGKDALEIMIDLGKKKGLEIFYSNRMNDTHDSFEPVTRPIKLDHPEYMLSTKVEGQKLGWGKYPDVRTLWAALNFEYPQIRQMTVDALREVCQSYDIDGIELDFLRHPLYFPPTMQHRAVKPEHIDMMNDMVRKIRAMTEEEGLKRGRSILVAARSECDLGLSRSIGLDVATWVQEGLIDILVSGSWVDFTLPSKQIIDLAHSHEVPVYPMVACNAQAKQFRDKSVWHGTALQRFVEGADGIYTFNIFEPTLWLWRQLGDPKVLAGLDATYTWDYLPAQRQTSDVLAKVRLTRFRWPVKVADGATEPIPLSVGQDLSAPPPAGKRRDLTLRIHLSVTGYGLTEDDGLEIKVNGKPLTEPSFSRPWPNTRIMSGWPSNRRPRCSAWGIIRWWRLCIVRTVAKPQSTRSDWRYNTSKPLVIPDVNDSVRHRRSGPCDIALFMMMQCFQLLRVKQTSTERDRCHPIHAPTTTHFGRKSLTHETPSVLH